MGLSMKDTFLAKYYKEEGKKEGIKEGIEEGIKEGIKEGRKEIAVRLLERGQPAEEVAEITGLSFQEVQKLKEM